MRTLLILVTAALLASPTITRGQEQQRTSSKSQPSPTSNSAPTRLALEILYFPGNAPAYFAVPGPEGKRSGGWFGRFSRLRDWQLPDGALPVDAVKIESQFNGETVDVYVSVIRGRFHDREDPVAAYHIGENDRRVVSELKSFGVEPFEIKIIRMAPTVVNPNNIVNKTQSIEVISIKAADSTLPKYQLTLRNLSSKSISALWLGVEHNGKIEISALLHHPEGGRLISAGDVYETAPFGVTRALEVGWGYVPQPSNSQTVVIGTVVFDDGSWEGDSAHAATFRAFIAGRRLQIASVIKSLNRISQKPDLSAGSEIADLRTEISRPDPDLIDAAYARVAGEFPHSSVAEQSNMRIGVEVVVHAIRNGLLGDLSDFERQHPQYRPEDFRAWLLTQKRMYEAWLHSL